MSGSILTLEVVNVQPVGSTAQLGLVTITLHVAAIRSWFAAIENVVCTVYLRSAPNFTCG